MPAPEIVDDVLFYTDTRSMSSLVHVATDPAAELRLARAWTALAVWSPSASDAQSEHGGRNERDDPPQQECAPQRG